MRALSGIGVVLLMVGLANPAQAKKVKERPVKVNPGGASQKWACEQLAEAGCDVAKRCEPDRSLRHCRKLRDRCVGIKERHSRTATEDDVTVCAQSVADLSCRQVTFDNTNGVVFDMGKLDACLPINKDNPLPKPSAAGKPAGGDDDDEDQAAPPKGGKGTAGDEQ